jgi:HK97 family phage prohead protease
MEQLRIKSYSSTINDVDEKGVIVKAVNAFGNEDAHKDISVSGSYSKTIQERFNRLRWYLNHDQKTLLGVPLEATQTDAHLIVKSRINLNKQVGRDTYEDYKLFASEGKSLEHSVGVIAVKRDQADKRKVLEWKWFEYSTLTNWGANPNTPMLSIKSEDNITEIIDFLELSLRKASYSDVKGKMIEGKIQELKTLLISEPSADTPPVSKPFDWKSALENAQFFNTKNNQ